MSYQQALQKTLDAARADSPGGLSTGEALMAALALNRHDWLQKMGYTIAEAMDRIESWAVHLPKVAREVKETLAQDGHAMRVAKETMDFASLARPSESETDGVDLTAKLITYGDSPGYRDTSFLFELNTLKGKAPIRAWLRVNPQDGERMARHIHQVHEFAWSSERGPLDKGPDEKKPRWIATPA